MELGKIQKAWVADLRKYPERQYTTSLGFKQKNLIKACCLGQGLLTLRELGEIDFNPFNDTNSINDCSLNHLSKPAFYLTHSYDKLGLRDDAGKLKTSVLINKEIVNSLAQANDVDISWLKIADYIEAHPENVFTKSV